MTIVQLICICLVVSVVICQQTNGDKWTVQQLIPNSYNKFESPNAIGEPLVVSIGIQVYDLVSVTESGQVCD